MPHMTDLAKWYLPEDAGVEVFEKPEELWVCSSCKEWIDTIPCPHCGSLAWTRIFRAKPEGDWRGIYGAPT